MIGLSKQAATAAVPLSMWAEDETCTAVDGICAFSYSLRPKFGLSTKAWLVSY